MKVQMYLAWLVHSKFPEQWRSLVVTHIPAFQVFKYFMLRQNLCSVLISFRMKRNRNLCRLGLLYVKSCYRVLLVMGLRSSCVRMMFRSCAIYVHCLTLILQRKLLTPSQTNLFSASIQKHLSDTKCEVTVSYYFFDIMLTYY